MLSLETLVGVAAALLTSLANLPQVIKAWRTHSTGDLSLKMVLMLGAGLVLWIVYGVVKGDMVIVLANVVSLLLVLNLLGFKFIEMRGARGIPGHG